MVNEMSEAEEQLQADEVVVRVAAETPFFTTRIAYISAATGNKELYLCDYDGANVMRLTSDQTHNLSPCWDRKARSGSICARRSGQS